MSSEPTRHRILAEATRLFARHGYGMTSVREVVEAAGVTKPALYYHFGSKERLFLEVMHSHLDAQTVALAEAVAGAGSVTERIRRLVDTQLHWLLGNRDALRLLMTQEHRPEHGAPQIDLMSYHARNGEALAGLIAEGVANGEFRSGLDIGVATLGLLGLVNLSALALMHGFPLDGDRLEDRIVDQFLHGVTP